MVILLGIRFWGYIEKYKDMSLLSIIVALIVIGIVLWLINNYIPMDQKIKTILNVVVILVVVIWLLSALGALSYLNRPVHF